MTYTDKVKNLLENNRNNAQPSQAVSSTAGQTTSYTDRVKQLLNNGEQQKANEIYDRVMNNPGMKAATKLNKINTNLVETVEREQNPVSRYRDYLNAPDFEQNSQYVPTQNGEQKINYLRTLLSGIAGNTGVAYDNTGYDDLLYEWINGNEEAGALLRNQDVQTYGGDNALQSMFAYATGGNQQAAEMTDEEKKIFNYLYATKSKDEAYDYYNALQKELNYRNRMTEQETWQNYAKENPVVASAFSVLEKPLGGISYAYQLADYLDDKQIDENASYNKFSYIPTTIRTEVSNKWGEKGSRAYQIGMSMADSLYNMLPAMTMGVAGAGTGAVQQIMLAVMGSEAAADTVLSMKDRGYDDQKTVVLGTIAGLAEYITERIGMDSLMGIVTGGMGQNTLAQYLIKSFLQQTGSEGLEEGLSDIINWFADDMYQLITDSPSEYRQTVNDYISQGYTESESAGLALKDRAKEIGLDVLGGAVSGALFGIGGAAVNLAPTVAKNVVNRIRNSRVSNAEANDLASQNNGTVPPQLGNETANIENAPQSVTEAVRAERSEAEIQGRVAEVRRAAASLGENGAKALTAAYDENMARLADPVQAVDVFNQVYNSALKGEQLSAEAEAKAAALPQSLRIAAESAGQRDAARAAQAAYFGEEAGLVQNEALRSMHLSSRTIRALDAVSKIRGVKAEIVDELLDANGEAVNAQYKNGVLQISAKAKNPVRAAFTHEIVHQIRESSPQAYKEMATFVQNNIKQFRPLLEFTYGTAYETSDINEVTEEIVADAFATITEHSDLLDRFVQDNRTTAQKLKDAIHDMIAAVQRALNKQNLQINENQRKAFSELMKDASEMEKLLENALKATAPQEISGRAVLAEEAAEASAPKYSLSSLMSTLNLTSEVRDGQRVWLDDSGNVITEITEKMVKNSGMGALLDMAITPWTDSRGNVIKQSSITAKEAKRQLAGLTKLMNMVLKAQDGELVWRFAGSAMFSAVKSNSDAQYGTTIDFSTVCRKTEEMMTAMSRAMMDMGRGLTKDEVIELQKKILEENGTVPCPVCYVFSRWAGIGGILDNMNRWQNKYEDYDEAELKERISVLEKATKTKKDLRKYLVESNDGYYVGLTGEVESLTQEKTQLKAKRKDFVKAKNTAAVTEIDERIKTIDETVAQLKTDIKNYESSGAPELAWLKKVRTQPGYKAVPQETLFDLNDAKRFAEDYPLSWGYRTSRGPSAGKAILPYSDMRLGDLILGANNNSAKGNDTFASVKNGFDKKQRTAIEKAIRRTLAQNLIGGQRFQSTSDFRYDYGLDYLQAFFEAQALGSKMQTYTKIVEFAEIVASIGGDCNLSVMPLDKGYKDGKLIFSSVTGMDIEAASKANADYDNVQLILVGINDEHIMLALEDNEETGGNLISFVIPYHASGASINQFIRGLVENLGESFNIDFYRDYSPVQNDSVRKNATAKQNARNKIRKQLLTGYTKGDALDLNMDISLSEGNAIEDGLETDNKRKAWTPSEKDKDFIRGKNKNISNRSFEELRDIEKRALAGDKKAIAEYESWSAGVLWDIYQKMWENSEAYDTYGVRLSSSQAEHIMPHEYWNTKVDRAHAYVNGFIFRSYCYSLGLTPRFTGINSSGNNIGYGDFSDSTGYWKTLIDRPMYNNDGTYREQQKVNVTELSPEMLTPEYGKKQWDGYQVAEPSDVRAENAARKFVEEKTGKKYSRDVFDDKYLELAKNPEKNKTELEQMVEEAARAAGYTEKAYHGTRGEKFNIFDPRFSADEISLFFTSDQDTANDYANARGKHGNVIPVYIDTENFVEIDAKGFSGVDIPYGSISEYDVRVTRKNSDTDSYNMVLTNRTTNETTEASGTYRDMVTNLSNVFGQRMARFLVDDSVSSESTIRIAWDSENMEEVPNSSVGYGKHPGTSNTRAIAKDVKQKGYAGAIIHNVVDTVGWNGKASDVYIVFGNTRIKSADPVTYDDNGNVIPLSERFNPDNSDIRYSRDIGEVLNSQTETLDRLSVEQALKDQINEYARTVKELNRAQQKADYWKGQTRLTKEPSVRESDVNKLARNLIKDYSSKVKTADIADRVRDLGNFILRGHDGETEMTWDEVRRKATDIARDIINNASALTDTGYGDYYAEIKNLLKDTQLRISRKDAADIADYKEWRKHVPGYLKLKYAETENSGNIDQVYTDLQRTYPWLFDEEVTGAASQLQRIFDVMSEIAPLYENPYNQNMAEAIEMCANDMIYGMMENVRQTVPTFADRQQTKLEKQKAADAEKLAKQKTKSAEKLNAVIAENRKRTKELLTQIRADRDAKLEELKQHYREVAEAKRNRKTESEERTRLLKVAKRLQKMKTTEANRTLINELVGDLDTVAKSVTGKTLERLNELQAWYADQKENNPNFIEDPHTEKALQRLSQRHISDLTIEEVRDLTDALLNIENEIRTQNELIDSKVRHDTYVAGAEAIEDIKNSKGSNGGIREKYLNSQILSPTRMLHRITGYKEADPLYIATQELADGQRKMYDYQRRANQRFTRWLEDKSFTRKITGKNSQEISITGMTTEGQKTVKITPAMRMSLYLHSLNAQNMKHIAEGGIKVPDMELYKKGKISEAYDKGTRITLTPSQVRRIIAGMTAQERAFARAASEYYNGQSRNEINETSEKLKGYSLAGVEAYFPIDTDGNFLKSDFESVKFDGSLQNMGFLKERVNAANPIMLYDLNSVLTKSINQHSKYVGLAIPVRNFSKLFAVNKGYWGVDDTFYYDTSMREAINSKWGKEGLSYIEKMMSDLNNPLNKRSAWDAALGTLRSRYAQSVLALNPSVALKQTASYFTAASEIGFAPLMKALADTHNIDMSLIEKYTPLLWYRGQGYASQEMGELAQQGKKLPKWLNWIQAMDLATTKKLWKAAEYYVKDTNTSLKVGTDSYYEAVADVYNRIIENTQPNYTTMQRPALLRSDSDLVKTMNMFKTQPFQNFNVLYDAIGDLNAKRTAYTNDGSAENRAAFETAKKRAAWAISSQAVSALMFAAMGALWDIFRRKDKKYRDDEDDITAGSFAKGLGLNVLSNSFGMLPFGGEMLEIMETAADGILKQYGQDPFFDARYYGVDVSIAETLTNLGQGTIDSFLMISQLVQEAMQSDKDINWETYARRTYDTLESFSNVAGLPVANVRKTVTAIAQNAIASKYGKKQKYIGDYYALRLTSDPERYKSDYYDLLYKAHNRDWSQYKDLYNIMLESGHFTQETIKSNMESRMKKSENVTSVKDLNQRWLPPAQQEVYTVEENRLEKSNLYKKATQAQQDDALDLLYQLVKGSNTSKAASARKRIEGGKSVGLDQTEYILYTIALSMADKPNSDGKLKTYTNAEVEEAIKNVSGLTSRERDYLWEAAGKSSKSTPEW